MIDHSLEDFSWYDQYLLTPDYDRDYVMAEVASSSWLLRDPSVLIKLDLRRSSESESTPCILHLLTVSPDVLFEGVWEGVQIRLCVARWGIEIKLKEHLYEYECWSAYMLSEIRRFGKTRHFAEPADGGFIATIIPYHSDTSNAKSE